MLKIKANSNYFAIYCIILHNFLFFLVATGDNLTFDTNSSNLLGIYPNHLKVQNLAGIRNAFRQGIDWR